MFINPSVQVIKQGDGLQGIYNIIASCASTCYQSVPKEGEKAVEFVNKLISNGHHAMLEFGTVYFKLPVEDVEDDDELMHWECLWEGSPYVDYDCDGNYFYVTTNVRHLLDCGLWADNMFKYMVSPTKFHERRTAFRIVTSIGVARELTRHRVFSFAQESTRYCNYSKDKFSNELSFIVPPEGDFTNDEYLEYVNALTAIEKCYMKLVGDGVSPQIAREVLPLSLKTELCMCGFNKDWKRFFDLRCDSHAHPHMVRLAKEIQKQLESK